MGGEEKTSNTSNSACFSPSYVKNKRANHSSHSFKRANRSSHSFKRANRSLVLKKTRVRTKTKERIPNLVCVYRVTVSVTPSVCPRHANAGTRTGFVQIIVMKCLNLTLFKVFFSLGSFLILH